jgi:CRP/FNR family transcriptional regulator, cyclic AMP receptor protein
MSAIQRSVSAPLTAPSMLDVLPEPGRDQVLRAARRRQFARGDMVLRQGDDASSLFIVETGHLAVRLLAPSGESAILTVMGPGEVLGEMAMLTTRHERTASVQAINDVTVRVLRADDFDRLRRQHPEVNDFLLQVLTHRADRLSRLVIEAYHMPVDQRIARRLLEVGRLFAGERMPVVLGLTQDEVAQLAGTTRPTANQVLKRLEGDGVVRLERGRVELHDIAGLRRHCG